MLSNLYTEYSSSGASASSSSAFASSSSSSTSYYHSNNGLYYTVPSGATNLVNTNGQYIGYQSTSGDVVKASAIDVLNQDQYNNIGVVAGAQAATTSINDSYYKAANGMYYGVPTGSINLINSTGQYMGYQNATGQVVSVNTLTGLSQNQYNQIGVVEGQQAANTSITDSVKMNQVGIKAGQVGISAGQIGQAAGNIGVKEGAQAATTSMDDSYVQYNGQKYEVPVGAIEEYNAQNQFQGYQMGGKTFSLADITSMSQTHSYDDVNVGRVEGAKAANTSITDSVKENKVGIIAGMAGKIGEIAGNIGVKMGLVGQGEGNVGVQEGKAAATTSMDETYYHYNNMYYKLPENAIITMNANKEFTGYMTEGGEQVMLTSMSGLDQGQFSALHIGQYEGAQAAITSMHDSVKENKVGINAGQVGINAAGHGIYGTAGGLEGHITTGLLSNSLSHINNIGVVAGEKAAHVSIHDSMKQNKVGIQAGQVGINAAGHGIYGTAGGLLRNHLESQVGINAGHIGQYAGNIGVIAGQQAKTTSITDSTSINNIGVKAGQAAATTSIDDSYMHVSYGGHIYQIPAGSIEQYNAQHEFTGYQLTTGEIITSAEMIAMSQSSTHSYYDGVNMGQVGVNAGHIGQYAGNIGKIAGQQAKTTSITDSTSINNIGVKAGQAAATTSIDDSYFHAQNGMYYGVPTGAIDMTNTTGAFTGYQTSTGEMISVNTLNGMTQDQINNIGVQEGQKAAIVSMTDTHVLQGTQIYTIPAGGVAQYDHTGVLTGYYTQTETAGSIAVYNVMNGVNTLSGYQVPISMMTGIAATTVNSAGASSFSSKSNCTSVSPVANGTPEYNHVGCITGYIVKNLQMMI